MPGRIARATNIASDKEAGIGNWAQEQFIARRKQYQAEAGRTTLLGESGNNSLVPRAMYADMTNMNLTAIYAYLLAPEARGNQVKV